MNTRYSNGPRCVVCGRPFVARQMQNGEMAQTCGNTACVARLTSRRNSEAASRAPRPTYSLY